jgi:polar amino acid transport system substrate-binding protein
VAAYAVKTSGGGNDFEVVGEQVEAAPYGIAVAKSNTELRDALKAALDAIIKNGEYDKIIAKWGVDGRCRQGSHHQRRQVTAGSADTERQHP